MKRILLLMTLTLVVLVCPGPAQGQVAVEVWVNHYNGLGNAGDHPTAVAVEAGGNVYVTGHSTGSDGNYDYTTIKYSGAGVPVWTNHYNGQAFNSDSANDLSVDGSGNVFVTGQSFNSTTSYDYATIKYSEAGVPLWTNRYSGPVIGPDVAVAIALDTNSNVFVTGYASATGNGSDYATIKYSGAGVPLWTNRYNGPGDGTDGATAIALDPNGDLLVTGVAGGNGTLADYATIKYSNAGMPLWTNLFNGSGNNDDVANAIAVDANGNVFVTGHQSGSGSGFDYATIKYSGAGVPLWTNLYRGIVNGTDVANAIALDAGGNVLVTGYSGNGFSTDYATIKYSNAGVPLWTNRYKGPGNTLDQATAIKVDTSSNVFVTGFSINSSNFYHYATIAYSGAGIPLWTNLYDGAGNNALFADPSLAVDQNGNVCVAGYSTGIGSSQDYTVIKYSAISPLLTVTRTPTNTVAISWPSPSTGFALQQNTNGIATANWSNITDTIQDDGTNKTLIVYPVSGNRFFRLFKQ
jgi:Beta-propeller repeat